MGWGDLYFASPHGLGFAKQMLHNPTDCFVQQSVGEASPTKSNPHPFRKTNPKILGTPLRSSSSKNSSTVTRAKPCSNAAATKSLMW